MKTLPRILLVVAMALGSVRLLASASALPALKVYERFIAIDGVCAWPRLSVLPHGELSALIWPYPNHGFVQGASEVWNSEDDGRTWRRTGTPVPNAPGTNRMNGAAGIADDGTYVVLTAGWERPFLPPWRGTLEDEAKLPEVLKNTHTLQPRPAVSHDGGRTWTQFAEMNEPRQANGNALTPFGRIASLPGGELGAMLYDENSWFFTSADGGRTWRRRGKVTTDGLHNECTWIRLENGDLFAAARGANNTCLDAYRSTDQGATWQPEGPLTMAGQHPADLTRLPDGRIALSFGIRNPGLRGVAVRFGDAEAHRWSSAFMLVDFEDSTDHPEAADPRPDGGYPSTVVAKDGTLVTAYYCRGIPQHRRYHMGVVRWSPPKPYW
jgi:hypothetical protein